MPAGKVILYSKGKNQWGKRKSNTGGKTFEKKVKNVLNKVLEKKHTTVDKFTPLLGIEKYSMITSADAQWSYVDMSPIIPVGTSPYQREGAQVHIKSMDLKMSFINPFSSYGFVRAILVLFKDDPETAITAGVNPIQWIYRQNSAIAVNKFNLNTPISNYTKVRKVLMDKTFNVTPQQTADVNFVKHIKKHIKLNYVANFNSAEEQAAIPNRTVGPMWLTMFLSAWNYANIADEPIIYNYCYKYSFVEK